MPETGVKLQVDTKGTRRGVFWMQLVDLAFLLQAFQIQNLNIPPSQLK